MFQIEARICVKVKKKECGIHLRNQHNFSAILSWSVRSTMRRGPVVLRIWKLSGGRPLKDGKLESNANGFVRSFILIVV